MRGTMRRSLAWIAALLLGLSLLLCACGRTGGETAAMPETGAPETAAPETAASENTATAAPALPSPEPDPQTQPVPEPSDPAADPTVEEEEEQMLCMKIQESPVAVDWEENEAVAALRELCREAPLEIEMSMYGGFEQVGPIGTALPRSDAQTRTAAGDIVLYAGDQLVVFYGSNSWAYTRLGHITDKSETEMAELLGGGDVRITLWLEGTR